MRTFIRIFITTMLVIISSAIYAQEFVNPIGFVDNEANRQKVIAYIKKLASAEPSLKEAEAAVWANYQKLQLDAFKELIKVKNTKKLEQVMKGACSFGMCNYFAIMEMYRASDSSYNPPLEW